MPALSPNGLARRRPVQSRAEPCRDRKPETRTWRLECWFCHLYLYSYLHLLWICLGGLPVLCLISIKKPYVLTVWFCHRHAYACPIFSLKSTYLSPISHACPQGVLCRESFPSKGSRLLSMLTGALGIPRSICIINLIYECQCVRVINDCPRSCR